MVNGPLADMWSFACILFEMLTGDKPFMPNDEQIESAQQPPATVPKFLQTQWRTYHVFAEAQRDWVGFSILCLHVLIQQQCWQVGGHGVQLSCPDHLDCRPQRYMIGLAFLHSLTFPLEVAYKVVKLHSPSSSELSLLYTHTVGECTSGIGRGGAFSGAPIVGQNWRVQHQGERGRTVLRISVLASG